MSRFTRSIATRFITLSLLAVFGASAAFAQNKAYVTNEAEGTVHVIDAVTHTLISVTQKQHTAQIQLCYMCFFVATSIEFQLDFSTLVMRRKINRLRTNDAVSCVLIG